MDPCLALVASAILVAGLVYVRGAPVPVEER